MLFATLLLSLALELKHDNHKYVDERSGTIAELRSDAVVLEDARKRRITINLGNTTIVHRDGRDAELPALRVGDRAVVEIMPNSAGGLDAVMVRARSAPKRRKKAPASPAHN